jgi:hypothetical protein
VGVTRSEFNSATGLVRYLLPRAAWVRIRAGIHEGPFLGTLQPWTPLAAGRRELAWDGHCGVLRDVAGYPDLRLTVVAVAPPANLLVDLAALDKQALEPPPSEAPTLSVPSAVKVLVRELRENVPWRETGAAGPLLVDDYRLNVKIAAPPADGQQLLAARIDIAPEQRERLLNRRFELMLFVDQVFLMEDERAVLPFSYTMDTRGLAPGRHLLTVNIVDVEGNLGTHSTFFDVPAAAPSPPPPR